MSVVTLKEISLFNQDHESTSLDSAFSIPAHSHYLFQPADITFDCYSAQEPTAVNGFRLKYNWVKKERINREEIDISMNCKNPVNSGF
ncbi:MAG: hypothetical protein ACFFD4_01845 [Candidatus Odinarchaeota archaeon]